ncbi:MAG TPA: hypothetical protein VN931_02385 [Fibrobacteria bacterium]|nr:hypothetical protein [Fibrobacteria bacterium]
MKTILMALSVVSGVALADGSQSGPPSPPFDSFQVAQTRYVDSVVVSHEAQDAELFAALPDSIRPLIAAATQAWKAVALADADQDPNQRAKTVDSLKGIFTQKRDSLLVLIKDSATRDQIRTRIAILESVRTDLKAKLEARKEQIAAKIAGMKAASK